MLSALAPVLVGLAATGATARLRHPAWRRVAMALGCWWLAEVIPFVYEVGFRREPFTPATGVAHLASATCTAWALLSFPSDAGHRRHRLKSNLDVLPTVLCAAMAVWYLVIGPILQKQPGTGPGAVVALAYPVGDLLLLSGVIGSVTRRTTANDRALRLLVAGVSSLVVADVAFAHLSLSGVHDGGVPDPLRGAVWCLFFLAARTAARTTARTAAAGGTGHRRSDGHPSLAGLGRSHPRRDDPQPGRLPYLAVALAYGLLLCVAQRSANYPLDGLVLGATAITAAVLVRQVSMIRENTRLMSRLRNLADVDPLTGIPNRRAFFEEAEMLFPSDRRGPAPNPHRHGVLMIDVDYFKEVNDTYGHRTGDRVLSFVAACVKSQLRSADLVGRYGGDELVVALADCDDPAAVAVAERIHAVVAATPVVTENGVVNVTLSIGVAGSENGEGLLPVLARADLALYEAKRAGRACVRQFAAHTSDGAPRRGGEAAMRTGR